MSSILSQISRRDILITAAAMLGGLGVVGVFWACYCIPSVEERERRREFWQLLRYGMEAEKARKDFLQKLKEEDEQSKEGQIDAMYIEMYSRSMSQGDWKDAIRTADMAIGIWKPIEHTHRVKAWEERKQEAEQKLKVARQK